jgi:uncharacterized membrane protein YozB (DUF420 family)
VKGAIPGGERRHRGGAGRLILIHILLAVRLVPAGLMQESRTAAASAEDERMLGRWGEAIIVILWLAGLTLATMWLRSLRTM